MRENHRKQGIPDRNCQAPRGPGLRGPEPRQASRPRLGCGLLPPQAHRCRCRARVCVCSLAAKRPALCPRGTSLPPGLGPQPRTRRPICWVPLRRLATPSPAAKFRPGFLRECWGQLQGGRNQPGRACCPWPTGRRVAMSTVPQGLQRQRPRPLEHKAETTAPVQLWSAPCRRPGEGGSSCVRSTMPCARGHHCPFRPAPTPTGRVVSPCPLSRQGLLLTTGLALGRWPAAPMPCDGRSNAGPARPAPRTSGTDPRWGGPGHSS